MSRDLQNWFRAIGVPLSEVYGMSETTGLITWSPMQAKTGTVGMAAPGIEVKLAADGEVLCRGTGVFGGYFKEPEKTAEALDADGWLHTGDIGQLDGEGYLRIVDRKKELIITAGGKNVSPANLEALLKGMPLVGQACAIGDDKPFVSALIALDRKLSRAAPAANDLILAYAPITPTCSPSSRARCQAMAASTGDAQGFASWQRCARLGRAHPHPKLKRRVFTRSTSPITRQYARRWPRPCTPRPPAREQALVRWRPEELHRGRCVVERRYNYQQARPVWLVVCARMRTWFVRRVRSLQATRARFGSLYCARSDCGTNASMQRPLFALRSLAARSRLSGPGTKQRVAHAPRRVLRALQPAARRRGHSRCVTDGETP